MKNRYQFMLKSYAMDRMAKAIERAIEASTIIEKERAARWAAAWGLLCDIRTKRVRLKESDLVQRRSGRGADKEVMKIDFPEIVFNSPNYQ